MHVRFSAAIGMPVRVDQLEEDVGTVRGILIHPVTLKVEGFFIGIRSFLRSQELFLSSLDIVHFGSRIRIRSIDALSPQDEIIRLQPLLADSRTVLGQMIMTESGGRIGRCSDVQFQTQTYHLEWLFPKKFFREQTPLPASSIVKVRGDAIVVRDPVLPLKVADAVPSVIATLEQLGTTTVSG